MQGWSKKSSHGGGVVVVVYLSDYRTTPGCLTLFYSVQLWIVATIYNINNIYKGLKFHMTEQLVLWFLLKFTYE